MTRRSLIFSVLILWLAQIALFADATNTTLAKSALLENDVLYLRVGDVGKNFAAEIQSAQNELATTNKIAGTILDLRFAAGDDLESSKAAADLFAQKTLPLAILVNGETRGAAAELATDLRAARAGLIFGSSKEIKTDIAVTVKTEEEKKFFENPYAALSQSETNSNSSTNDFSPFIDHTSEADLVRAKIKDGDEDEDTAPAARPAPAKPVIRDPVLARAVDLIKALAIVRQSHV
jgi:Peptidase family S41